MNAAKQASWLFGILVLLACSGWYFASETPKLSLDEQSLIHTADTIISGLRVRQFNVDGKLSHFLESESMAHVPNNDTHLLQSPHIFIRQDNAPAWEITAKEAESIQKGQQITFQHQVVVHQEKGEKTEESTFSTEKLLYFPKKKLATSDLPVVFKQQGSVVHSIGMNAYLQEKHVELLGKAHITFEPHHG